MTIKVNNMSKRISQRRKTILEMIDIFKNLKNDEGTLPEKYDKYINELKKEIKELDSNLQSVKKAKTQ